MSDVVNPFKICMLCVLCKVRLELKKNFCNVCVKSAEANRRMAMAYLKEQCENEN